MKLSETAKVVIPKILINDPKTGKSYSDSCGGPGTISVDTSREAFASFADDTLTLAPTKESEARALPYLFWVYQIAPGGTKETSKHFIINVSVEEKESSGLLWWHWMLIAFGIIIVVGAIVVLILYATGMFSSGSKTSVIPTKPASS